MRSCRTLARQYSWSFRHTESDDFFSVVEQPAKNEHSIEGFEIVNNDVECLVSLLEQERAELFGDVSTDYTV